MLYQDNNFVIELYSRNLLPKILIQLQVRNKINNIHGLQTFNLLRFISFLIISIILSKSHLSIARIGDFEIMLFIASIASFFWMTGLIQSFLSLYNNNKIFKSTNEDQKKSPEIFNAFIIICLFSLLFVLVGILVRNNLYVYSDIKKVPYFNLLIIYFLLSNPAHLVEYIFVLKNKSTDILYYAFITYSLQVLLVGIPILLGYDIKHAFWGLIVVSVLRVLMLVKLLIKYAEFKISIPFLKAHLTLSYPLIISVLLSGSAQYIDGLIVARFSGPGAFAYFRYGAKELPFVVMLASGLHNAMIPVFSKTKNLEEVLLSLKRRTRRLVNSLFPLTIGILLIANPLYITLFNQHFRRGADVFMMYLLLIISRLIFPQTILIGLKKTNVVLWASMLSIVLNTLLSIYLIHHYEIVGVALATVIVFLIEKAALVSYIYYELGIHPTKYIPLRLHLFYTIVLITIFVLIDRRVIVLH